MYEEFKGFVEIDEVVIMSKSDTRERDTTLFDFLKLENQECWLKN